MVLKKRFCSLMLVFLLILLVLSGCGSKTTGGEAQSLSDEKETVVVRMEGGDYGLLQPYTTNSRGPGKYKVNLIFEKLIEKDEKGYVPWLASNWEVLDDGKRIVFDLREGINWQDGKDFTAEDVVFTFDYIQKYPPVGAADLLLDEKFLLDVRSTDTNKVEFILSEAKANFIEDLFTISILPKHIWENIDRPDEFIGEEALIGTGPYKLTDYNREHGSYRLEAYEGFWGPKPLVDIIEFVPVSDEVLALEKGDIDIAEIPVDVLERFKNNSDFTLMEKPGIVWAYRLKFNMEKVPDFTNKQLRQAFAYTIDRQELVDKIARGAGVPGSIGILPKGHAWYNPDLPKYERDIIAAKGLLRDMGIKDQTYELIVGDGSEVRLGELIKEQMEDIGINIKIVALDKKSRDGRIAEGNYQLALVGHGGWARDPDYLRIRFSPEKGNWSSGTPGYINEELQELLTAQSTETNDIVRRQMIYDIQKILAEDVPEIPLYFTTGTLVYRNNVYDGWMHIFDHHEPTHNKLSYLQRL